MSDQMNVESRNRATDIQEAQRVGYNLQSLYYNELETDTSHPFFSAILKESIRNFVDVVEGDAMDMS
jgi:hypothetical protein